MGQGFLQQPACGDLQDPSLDEEGKVQMRSKGGGARNDEGRSVSLYVFFCWMLHILNEPGVLAFPLCNTGD